MIYKLAKTLILLVFTAVFFWLGIECIKAGSWFFLLALASGALTLVSAGFQIREALK